MFESGHRIQPIKNNKRYCALCIDLIILKVNVPVKFSGT
jgi:hypothetical protein